MNIDNAMLATRRYFVLAWGADSFTVGTNRPDLPSRSLELGEYKTRAAAQIVCDRLNLLAVLEAIREPSDSSLAYVAPEEDAAKAHWINMIDALIAEVKAPRHGGASSVTRQPR